MWSKKQMLGPLSSSSKGSFYSWAAPYSGHQDSVDFFHCFVSISFTVSISIVRTWTFAITRHFNQKQYKKHTVFFSCGYLMREWLIAFRKRLNTLLTCMYSKPGNLHELIKFSGTDFVEGRFSFLFPARVITWKFFSTSLFSSRSCLEPSPCSFLEPIFLT